MSWFKYDVGCFPESSRLQFFDGLHPQLAQGWVQKGSPKIWPWNQQPRRPPKLRNTQYSLQDAHRPPLRLIAMIAEPGRMNLGIVIDPIGAREWGGMIHNNY